jgi:hypothetical protein
MAFHEDPEKLPIPDPSTETHTTASQYDEEKAVSDATDDDARGEVDKELDIEAINSGHGEDMEKQDVITIPLCTPKDVSDVSRQSHLSKPILKDPQKAARFIQQAREQAGRASCPESLRC